MNDPHVREYARLLVDRCVGVQPGWQVSVRSTPLARPLVEAVLEEIARRGAYPVLQLVFELVGGPFAREAPAELLREASAIQQRIWTECDAFITIWAPENTREGSELSAERQAALEEAAKPLRERTMSLSAPWVICEYPVPATAQEAGMSLDELERFVYGAVLLDWDAEGARMQRYADRFDGAKEVRIVGAGTDLRLSLEGRSGTVDDGHVNMPGGEFFYSPVEDSAEGTIEFGEFPAIYFGNEVEGVQLRFEAGVIIDASARSGEEFLLRTLDTDAGSRRIGELGIGCNPGIQRFMKNVGFDEKIDGTIHLAVGASYSFTGGTNESSVHWDIVKDLRSGGKIFVDGELVQQGGVWLI